MNTAKKGFRFLDEHHLFVCANADAYESARGLARFFCKFPNTIYVRLHI